MSGGSFQYAYSTVERFAEDLEISLDKDLEISLDVSHDDDAEELNCWNPKTIEQLRRIVADARDFAKVMKAVEWLYSADIGEDTFFRHLLEIELKKLGDPL